MADTANFEHREIHLNTGKVAYIEAGSGNEVVYLHHSWGSPGALEFHNLLTQKSNRVVIPDMPGWGGSDRPVWARSVRDIAILVGQTLDALELTNPVVIGAGFGGYVASELATMNPSLMKSMILIGSAGLLPEEGEILDQMMYSHRQYISDGFRDAETYVLHMGEEPAQELRELWDLSREMLARVSWKPYLHNRRLQPLLSNVNTSTLVIWGENDKVVPLSVARQFERELNNCSLHVIKNAGHLVEFEEPQSTCNVICDYIANLAHRN